MNRKKGKTTSSSDKKAYFLYYHIDPIIRFFILIKAYFPSHSTILTDLNSVDSLNYKL